VFQVHSVTQKNIASSVKWRMLCSNEDFPYRTCSKYILLHRKHQIRAFQAILNCLQQDWSGFRRNKFSPSSDASYV